jgi:hypothetical protein
MSSSAAARIASKMPNLNAATEMWETSTPWGTNRSSDESLSMPHARTAVAKLKVKDA